MGKNTLKGKLKDNKKSSDYNRGIAEGVLRVLRDYGVEIITKRRADEMMGKSFGVVEEFIMKTTKEGKEAKYGDVCLVMELSKRMGLDLTKTK